MFSSIFKTSSSNTLDERVLAAPQSITKENVGVLFGDVYLIKISADPVDVSVGKDEAEKSLLMTFDQARQVLDLLDATPNGRGAPIANIILSGNFLLARSDSNAMHHYHLHARSLHRPIVYMQHLLNEMNATFAQGVFCDVKLAIRKITRDAVSKGLFNLSEIPASLDVALSKFYGLIDDSSESLEKALQLKLSAGSAAAKAYLYLSPYYTDIRKTYAENITVFLQGQADIVLKELHDAANDVVPTNILTLSVMELIKEDQPECRASTDMLKKQLAAIDLKALQGYLNRPELIALPGGVAATENLNIVFHNTLLVLHQNPALQENLLAALKNLLADVAFTAPNLKTIKELFEKDERDNGLLHRFYLELLRREHIGKTVDHLRLESNIFRYTDRNICYGNHTIPAGSTLVFLPAFPRFDERLYPNSDVFDPDRYLQNKEKHLDKYPLTIFAETNRRCPAHAVTSYIAKMFISHLLLHYDFDLEKVNADDAWPTRLAITPKANVVLTFTN